MKKKITCVVYEVGNEDDQTWEMWFENFSRRFLIKKRNVLQPNRLVVVKRH